MNAIVKGSLVMLAATFLGIGSFFSGGNILTTGGYLYQFQFSKTDRAELVSTYNNTEMSQVFAMEVKDGKRTLKEIFHEESKGNPLSKSDLETLDEACDNGNLEACKALEGFLHRMFYVRNTYRKLVQPFGQDYSFDMKKGFFAAGIIMSEEAADFYKTRDGMTGGFYASRFTQVSILERAGINYQGSLASKEELLGKGVSQNGINEFYRVLEDYFDIDHKTRTHLQKAFKKFWMNKEMVVENDFHNTKTGEKIDFPSNRELYLSILFATEELPIDEAYIDVSKDGQREISPRYKAGERSYVEFWPLWYSNKELAKFLDYPGLNGADSLDNVRWEGKFMRPELARFKENLSYECRKYLWGQYLHIKGMVRKVSEDIVKDEIYDFIHDYDEKNSKKLFDSPLQLTEEMGTIDSIITKIQMRHWVSRKELYILWQECQNTNDSEAYNALSHYYASVLKKRNDYQVLMRTSVSPWIGNQSGLNSKERRSENLWMEVLDNAIDYYFRYGASGTNKRDEVGAIELAANIHNLKKYVTRIERVPKNVNKILYKLTEHFALNIHLIKDLQAASDHFMDTKLDSPLHDEVTTHHDLHHLFFFFHAVKAENKHLRRKNLSQEQADRWHQLARELMTEEEYLHDARLFRQQYQEYLWQVYVAKKAEYAEYYNQENKNQGFNRYKSGMFACLTFFVSKKPNFIPVRFLSYKLRAMLLISIFQITR